VKMVGADAWHVVVRWPKGVIYGRVADERIRKVVRVAVGRKCERPEVYMMRAYADSCHLSPTKKNRPRFYVVASPRRNSKSRSKSSACVRLVAFSHVDSLSG